MPWIERDTLTASDAADSDYFGFGSALSADGTILAVGAYAEDTAGSNAGKVYIYDWSGSAWVERNTVTASDAETSDYFGYSCALSADGTVLAVGAYAEDTAGSGAGKVYIYDWNGSAWVERNMLTASDAADGDSFGVGCALSADGTVLAVGAHAQDTAASNAGKVYIYDWNGSAWVERNTLVASDAANDDYFGISCALSADGAVLAVGAHYEDTAELHAGKVYIYDWNGSAWVERNTVTASDAEPSAFFGVSCALSSDGAILAVGAYAEDTAGSNAGKVYIYDWNGSAWVERNTLVASDAADSDYFGISCALSADGAFLAISASHEDTAGDGAGKVYIYNIPAVATSIRSVIDLQYGDLIALNRTVTDMLYHSLLDRRSHVDMLYGLRLMAFASMYYGNKPMPRAVLDMYFGDCPILRRSWELKYSNMLMLRKSVDMHYVIPQEMRNIVEMRYGINGEAVRAFVDMGYEILDINRLRQAVDMHYVLQAGTLLQPIESSVTIGGRKVKCSLINVEASITERFISAEIHLPYEADYIPIQREEPFILTDTLDGVSHVTHLQVENKRISRPQPGQRNYIVTALSPIMTLSAPWSRPLTEDPAPGAVETVVNELLGDVGPVDWQTVSFPVLADTLTGVDEEQITVARKLTASIGAKFQSNPDGSVRVIQEYQKSPPEWADAEPDYFLTARDFVSQDDTPVHNPGHNKFLISSDSSADGRTWPEQESVSDNEFEIYGFQVPWGYVEVLGLTHTGGDHVPEAEYTGVVEEIYPPENEDPEQVVFESGFASASRPVYGSLSVEWLEDSLGAVTFSEDGTLEAADKEGVSAGYGLAEIRYKTKFHLWTVKNETAEDVLYIIWVADQ